MGSAATGWKPARDSSINIAVQAVALQSQYPRAGASTNSLVPVQTSLRYPTPISLWSQQGKEINIL